VEVNASLINFAAGQLSKKFLGRVDLPNFYNSGTLLCRNFIPQPQGPAMFRPGSRYVLHTRLNRRTALFPFVFNDEQAYALAFSDRNLRFFSDGGAILESATPNPFGFDEILRGTTTPTYTGSGTSGAGVNTIDGDLATYWHARAEQGGGGSTQLVLYSSHAFSGTVDITALIVKSYVVAQTSSGASSNTANAQVYVQYYDGAWKNLTGADATAINASVSASGDSTQTQEINIEHILETPLSCSAIRMVIYARAEQNGAGGSQQANAYGYELQAYSPTTGVKRITGVTQANPGVFTVTGHGYSGGEEIFVSEVEGMTELNGKSYLVVYIDANTFSLTDIDGDAIDTSAYTAYTSGGVVDAIYEVDTPYLEADLKELKFAQKADLMYIVHPDYAPRKLTRSGEASWSLDTFTRTADPFTKTITGITRADPGVVSATAHGFENGDIIQIEDVVGMTEVNMNQYKVANKAANTFELTDPDTDEDVDTSGFTAWSSGGVVFKAGNMPGAVAFNGGRVVYGGTDDDPETFWGSRGPTSAGANRYDDYTTGADADHAYVFPISSQNNTADRIQWFAGTSKFLAIGTFGGIYKATGSGDGTPITGTDIDVKPAEFVGCKYRAPIRVGSSLFYIQRGGLILNAFAFSLLSDDFKASSLNVFSDEITDSGLEQLAVQQGLSDIIWSCTDDGRLLGITIMQGEDINAWHEHPIGGTDVKVLSVCGEPQEDNQDSQWIVVERTIDGSTKRYIEYFEMEDLLPESEDYYTGTKAADEQAFNAMLFEEAKHLVRVDSSLTLDNSQTIALTPGAVTGTGIAFTAAGDIFAATDVGRYIKKKHITGEETGIALITAYVSATEVTCTITEDFDSVTQMGTDEWYLTFTSVTGLDHLEGETVRAQIDGEDDGTDYTVSGGAITLGSPATVAHVGLPYTGRLTPMPLNIGALAGTAQGKITTVNRLCLLFRHSRGTKYGTDVYRTEQVQDRDYTPDSNRPSKLVTGVEFLNIPDGYDRRKFVHIIQDTANPCTVQGIVPYVDTTNE
jgi:hypothetical protein